MTDRRCWLCGQWGLVAKHDTGETSWSDATGGERGQRFPVYSLLFAPGVVAEEDELIACPVCSPSGESLPLVSLEEM